VGREQDGGSAVAAYQVKAALQKLLWWQLCHKIQILKKLALDMIPNCSPNQEQRTMNLRWEKVSQYRYRFGNGGAPLLGSRGAFLRACRRSFLRY
jgi:hypothetical protein